MEKEKVLEIEITKINDDWSAVTVKKIKKDFENNDFFEWLTIGGNYLCDRKIFINRIYPHTPFLIRNEIIELIEDVVNTINEKYGIIKRWRAEKGEIYYYMGPDGDIIETNDWSIKEDNDMYELGNYFETKREAQKISNSKEWQNFWAKVRAGEIGGDE